MKAIAPILVMLCLAGCGVEPPEAGEHDGASTKTVSLYQKDRGLLLPAELRASLGVTLAELADAPPVLVPKAAVIYGVQEDFVYVENGEHIVRTPVASGQSRGDQIEITEGLLGGDRVVTAGAHDLWMIELLAIRGGSPCCPAPKKEKR